MLYEILLQYQCEGVQYCKNLKNQYIVICFSDFPTHDDKILTFSNLTSQTRVYVTRQITKARSN